MKGACFDTFPFPDLTGALAAEIGVLAEELDATRAQVLRNSADLTMTGLYNAKMQIGRHEPLTEDERILNDQGRIGIIDHLHQRLDQLVSRAYGWPDDLSDSQIVERLITLNKMGLEEEARGDIRFCVRLIRPARFGAAPSNLISQLCRRLR